jgi:hypothetical protein
MRDLDDRLAAVQVTPPPEILTLLDTTPRTPATTVDRTMCAT